MVPFPCLCVPLEICRVKTQLRQSFERQWEKLLASSLLVAWFCLAPPRNSNEDGMRIEEASALNVFAFVESVVGEKSSWIKALRENQRSRMWG